MIHSISGHCQRFAPLFIQTSTKHADLDVNFAAVDCVEHRDLCSEQQVHSYPTILVYGFGEEIEKDFARRDAHTIPDVEDFIKKFKNNFETPNLRRHPLPNKEEKKEMRKSDPYVTPPMAFDSNYKLEEHYVKPQDALWINK